MTDITQAEAEKLFQEVSQSIRDNDTSKLDTLVEAKPVEGNPEVVEPAAVVEPQLEEQPQETPTSVPNGTQGEPTPAGDQPEEVAEPATAVPDDLANLKAQLDTLKKENHHLKSQAGRMPHMQSKVKELDKKLEELRTHLSSPSSQPSTKIKPELEKQLAKLRETDPELADTWEATLLAASDTVARENLTAEIARTESLRKAEYENYFETEKSRLVEEIPNAFDIFKDKHWAEWKQQQSKAMQALASSDSADDVVFALRRYEADMRQKYPELAEQPEATPAPAVVDPAVAEKAKQVETARQQRKQTSVVTGTPNAPAQVSTPSDPASLFKKFSEEIRKERLG